MSQGKGGDQSFRRKRKRKGKKKGGGYNPSGNEGTARETEAGRIQEGGRLPFKKLRRRKEGED